MLSDIDIYIAELEAELFEAPCPCDEFKLWGCVVGSKSNSPATIEEITELVCSLTNTQKTDTCFTDGVVSGAGFRVCRYSIKEPGEILDSWFEDGYGNVVPGASAVLCEDLVTYECEPDFVDGHCFTLSANEISVVTFTNPVNNVSFGGLEGALKASITTEVPLTSGNNEKYSFPGGADNFGFVCNKVVSIEITNISDCETKVIVNGSFGRTYK